MNRSEPDLAAAKRHLVQLGISSAHAEHPNWMGISWESRQTWGYEGGIVGVTWNNYPLEYPLDPLIVAPKQIEPCIPD